jgi:hypothetical protein
MINMMLKSTILIQILSSTLIWSPRTILISTNGLFMRTPLSVWESRTPLRGYRDCRSCVSMWSPRCTTGSRKERRMPLRLGLKGRDGPGNIWGSTLKMMRRRKKSYCWGLLSTNLEHSMHRIFKDSSLKNGMRSPTHIRLILSLLLKRKKGSNSYY